MASVSNMLTVDVVTAWMGFFIYLTRTEMATDKPDDNKSDKSVTFGECFVNANQLAVF